MRRAPAAAAWGFCLLMLASGSVGAAEPVAHEPPPAPVRSEPATPATPATATDAATSATPATATDAATPATATVTDAATPATATDAAPPEDAVWGEEALMQADFPPEMQAAAEELTRGPQVLCSGVVSQTHKPGLLMVTTQDSVQHGKVQFIDCPVNDGVVVKAMSLDARPQKNATCLTKPEGPSTATVSWSNGESSVLELKDVEATVEGDLRIFTSKGTVKSGRHPGKAVKLSTSVSLTSTLAACIQSSGLTTTMGIATLTLLDP